MDIDTLDPTEPRLDSQITINTNNSEDATRTQTNFHLSDSGSAAATKMPCVETVHTPVHLASPRELAPLTDAQTPQSIAGLPVHKDDIPVDIQHAKLLIATPGKFFLVASKCIFSFFFSSSTVKLCGTGAQLATT